MVRVLDEIDEMLSTGATEFGVAGSRSFRSPVRL